MTKIYANHQDLELKDFFRFEGRINRLKYIDIWGWNFTVRLTFLLSYIMFNALGAQSNSDTLKNIGIISLVFFGLTLLVGAVSLILNGIRRAHDCNQSGWFSIIPIYNIYLIWLKKGTEGENEYGNNPLEKKLSENPLDEAKFKKHKKIENENIDNQVNKKKRPIAITVICGLGFIGTAFIIPLIFSDISVQIGNWYPPYLGLSAISGLVIMIGLWQMKKWAAYTYTGFVELNQIVFLTMGIWNIKSLIIPAIVVIVPLTHLKKMQ